MEVRRVRVVLEGEGGAGGWEPDDDPPPGESDRAAEESDSGQEDEEGPSRPQLNMRHGFMAQIIRNQVERDEYDKELKRRSALGLASQPKPASPSKISSRQEGVAVAEDSEGAGAETKPGRRAKAVPQLYVPPHRKLRDGAGASAKQAPPKALQSPPTPPAPSSVPSRKVVKAAAAARKAKEPLPGQLELELEDSAGQIHSFKVHKDQDPVRATKIIAQQLQLKDQQAARLRSLLEKQLIG